MAPIHRDASKALYLKMKNLSVPGIFHLEGVSNDCKTIFDALQFRFGEEEEQYEAIGVK